MTDIPLTPLHVLKRREVALLTQIETAEARASELEDLLSVVRAQMAEQHAFRPPKPGSVLESVIVSNETLIANYKNALSDLIWTDGT